MNFKCLYFDIHLCRMVLGIVFNITVKFHTEKEEIILERPIPPECHTEAHTDYDGAAVRWGLTHHKESAADCCQACLDQANRAKPGEMKCNIWVYCPSEAGCFSPDKYEHKHQECWLKQKSSISLSFGSWKQCTLQNYSLSDFHQNSLYP
ncbi:hypothetical protein AAC387_Pa09g1076 [Persea americana]